MSDTITTEAVVNKLCRVICDRCAKPDKWEPAKKLVGYLNWWHERIGGGRVEKCDAAVIHQNKWQLAQAPVVDDIVAPVATTVVHVKSADEIFTTFMPGGVTKHTYQKDGENVLVVMIGEKELGDE